MIMMVTVRSNKAGEFVFKEDLRQKAVEIGFALMGVTTTRRLEDVEFPADRGMKRPSEVLPGARSVVVLGFLPTDPVMNLGVQTRSEEGEFRFYHFYRETTEMLAWRLARWMRVAAGVDAIPSHDIHVKVAAQLAGLGFVGRSTLVIHPEYGPKLRWVTLLTDAEIEADHPFERDLCAEQLLCTGMGLCIKACPCGAIRAGDSFGVPPGKKVILERCCIEHVTDPEPEPKWEKYIHRVSEFGYIECTRCADACPYG